MDKREPRHIAYLRHLAFGVFWVGAMLLVQYWIGHKLDLWSYAFGVLVAMTAPGTLSTKGEER